MPKPVNYQIILREIVDELYRLAEIEGIDLATVLTDLLIVARNSEAELGHREGADETRRRTDSSRAPQDPINEG